MVTIPADVTVFSTTVTAEPRPIVKPVNSDTPTEEIQTGNCRSNTYDFFSYVVGPSYMKFNTNLIYVHFYLKK